jgi:retron-type reverse transcriptase
MTQSFNISKHVVVNAYKAVKANAGAAGIDRQTIAEFETNLTNNLYKLWNRMSSGSYVPPPVKAVEIPKASGGVRILGIPTVTDRIAQMIVKHELEPEIEPLLHYAFDEWMKRNHPNIPWCRYADDGLAHCRTYHDAEQLLTALESRFKECGLGNPPIISRSQE